MGVVKKTLLITSAGRRVGLMDCFRESAEALGIELRILAADANVKMSPACWKADKAFTMPKCEEVVYIPKLLELCQNEGVDLVIPTIDPELPQLSRHKRAFEDIGTRLVISELNVIETCNNKIKTDVFLRENGIRTPKGFGETEGPWIVKPIDGSNSQGVKRVNNLETVPEGMIAQEYWEGEEFTVNVFYDGRARCVIPHLREEVRGGEVSKGVTVRDDVLQMIAEKIGAGFGNSIYGPVCFQGIKNSKGEIAVTDINPRFGGGYPLAHRAGGVFTKWLLEDEPRYSNKWRSDITMLRFDEAVYKEDEKKKVVIVGTSGQARVVIDIMEAMGCFEIVGLLDKEKNPGESLFNYEVLGNEEKIPELMEAGVESVVVAVGDNWTRSQVMERIQKEHPEIRFPSIVHPSAVIGKEVEVGEGSVVMARAVVNPNTRIGRGCIVNTKASVDHDSVLEDFSSIAPSSTLGGNVHVGLMSAVCLGTNVIHGISIGNHTVVGAGSTVLENIGEQVVSYGVPAKEVRRRDIGEVYL